ncbi:MAG: TolC family protein [Gammaproteobacteria bacterium]|nr:TolC family protein [Gammaproteobacteria bacterium]
MKATRFVFLPLLALLSTGFCLAQPEMPAPWPLEAVVDMAREQRQEIIAARARADAARERPVIVSALEDPMLAPSIDHYPFDRMASEEPMPASTEPPMEGEPASAPITTSGDDNDRRYDWSVSIEQRFPLSKVLTHRRHAAEADAEKAAAEADRMALDVELEAITAFYMVQEKRRMATVVQQQIALARQFVNAANARYGSGSGNQSEVLRVEVEVARLESSARALQAGIRSAEAMLNTSIGRDTGMPVPDLVSPKLDNPLPSRDEVSAAALRQRPELQMGNAELSRAMADVQAMRSMYSPMGMVRVGYASTMAEGKGAMLMVGVSLPIWRDKLRGGVAEARAMERMASADLESMKRMVEGDAIAARDQLEVAQIQYLALRDDVVPRAHRLIQPTLSVYASGQGNLFAVIEAAQALWDVEAEFVMAETTLGVAWALLDRMTGTTKDHTP